MSASSPLQPWRLLGLGLPCTEPCWLSTGTAQLKGLFLPRGGPSSSSSSPLMLMGPQGPAAPSHIPECLQKDVHPDPLAPVQAGPELLTTRVKRICISSLTCPHLRPHRGTRACRILGRMPTDSRIIRRNSLMLHAIFQP